jgi:hypothetical protein
MINGKQFKMVTDKFMSSPTVQNARVQVCLPNGEFYDIKGIQLMENKLIGVRETHRLVITIEPEKWRMGKVKSLVSSLSYLYEGYKIEELVARGLSLDACCSKLDACCLLLESLGA